MIGLAQVTAGVALLVLSGGTSYFISLIAEGVGDMIYAVQSQLQGNFSWKAYSQHKLQSLMITVITLGVCAYLSKGAQATKLAVGLATKVAIAKAILKMVIVEATTAIVTSLINVGTEEICKLIINELGSVHFVASFETRLAEDATHKQKSKEIEAKLLGLYEKFGASVARASINAFKY